MDKVLCDDWGRWRVSRESCREVLDVRGNDDARQLVHGLIRCFHKSAHLKRQLAAALTPRLPIMINSLTPPRKNSMESDRPTHVSAHHQSQASVVQHQARCCLR